jgi:hypothetical protein
VIVRAFKLLFQMVMKLAGSELNELMERIDERLDKCLEEGDAVEAMGIVAAMVKACAASLAEDNPHFLTLLMQTIHSLAEEFEPQDGIKEDLRRAKERLREELRKILPGGKGYPLYEAVAATCILREIYDDMLKQFSENENNASD